jgi:hypothetical protein
MVYRTKSGFVDPSGKVFFDKSKVVIINNDRLLD